MDKKTIKEYLPLVRSIASKYSHNNIPYDDLIQEGTIGLWKAWQRYDDSKDAKFSTYAVYWIKKYISEAVNKETKSSLNAVSYNDTISTKKSKNDGIELKQEIKFPRDFPKLEKKILVMLYGLKDNVSYDLSEISEQLKIPRERVRQLKEKGLRRIRKLGLELK